MKFERLASRKAFPYWSAQRWDDTTPRHRPAEKGHRYPPRPSYAESSRHFQGPAEQPEQYRNEALLCFQNFVVFGKQWRECPVGFLCPPKTPSVVQKWAAPSFRGGKPSHGQTCWSIVQARTGSILFSSLLLRLPQHDEFL